MESASVWAYRSVSAPCPQHPGRAGCSPRRPASEADPCPGVGGQGERRSAPGGGVPGVVAAGILGDGLAHDPELVLEMIEKLWNCSH
jgi:hypothetical protein